MIEIVRQIRAMILSGDLKGEESLPSIRQLARDEKISVITVQRAYETLEREGFIHSRRGKGFYVSVLGNNTKKEIALDSFKKRIEPIIEIALSEGIKIFEIKKTITDIINSIEE